MSQIRISSRHPTSINLDDSETKTTEYFQNSFDHL